MPHVDTKIVALATGTASEGVAEVWSTMAGQSNVADVMSKWEKGFNFHLQATGAGRAGRTGTRSEWRTWRPLNLG